MDVCLHKDFPRTVWRVSSAVGRQRMRDTVAGSHGLCPHAIGLTLELWSRDKNSRFFDVPTSHTKTQRDKTRRIGEIIPPYGSLYRA